MNKAISLTSIIPVRIEPSEKSEMVTQLLFGETFTVKDMHKDWCNIVMDFDKYEGWLTNNMCVRISNLQIAKPSFLVLKEEQLLWQDTTLQKLSAGSELPGYQKSTKTFCVNGLSFSVKGNSVINNLNLNKDSLNLFNIIANFLHTPYLWGGRSIWGIDCSGFVQLVFKLQGIQLPRDTFQQVKHGKTVSFVDEVKDGDIAFFDNENGEVTHVGICIHNNDNTCQNNNFREKKIIHSYGKVRIDKLDQNGIFNVNEKKYTHKLRIIKRLINTTL